MIGDILTIVWKEYREYLFIRGNLRGGLLGLVFFIGVFGIFMPLQNGRAWIESPIGLIYWSWIPLFLVAGVIADSFAGERERHTLETLLASRLSDRAILFGKTLASIGYGWGVTMAGVLLSLVTVNVAHGQGRLLLYPAEVGLGIVVLSLLAAGVSATAGVLVSLRASTVRQAAQTLSITIMLLIFVPVFGVQALPDELKGRIAQVVQGADVLQVVIGAALVFAVLDVALLLAAMARFQRARLILD